MTTKSERPSLVSSEGLNLYTVHVVDPQSGLYVGEFEALTRKPSFFEAVQYVKRTLRREWPLYASEVAATSVEGLMYEVERYE